ncbi:hypothetical protein FRB95_000175 [Tulasnella sp. JGI-2019a]|nr:hypothetical protein FRB95_000175 [Tulasnella sp. JGI-2019a]
MMSALQEEGFREHQEATTITLEWTVRNLRNLFDASKGDQKSRVTKSAKFYGGRWQILLYPNSGHEGGYVSLYLSCEPTQEEKESSVNGKWVREGLFKFSFDLKSVNHMGTSQVTYNTKEACDHAFSWKTMNWGWAQFAKRDAVYYNAVPCKAADAFLIVCTITSSPVSPTPPSIIPKVHVPKSLVDSIGSLLDDPSYSDVEFVLPSRLKRGATKRIYANKRLLSRGAEYFDTMFNSGFAEAGEGDLDSQLANMSLGIRDPIPDLEDSDESGAEEESGSTITDDTRSNLARKPRSVGSTDHDAPSETQSDTGFPQPTAIVSLDDDDGGIVNEEMARSSETEAGGSGHPHAEASPTADQPFGEQRAMRQKLQQPLRDDDAPPAMRVAEASTAEAKSSVMPRLTPKMVVVRDGAYRTYYAFLYYLYTDSIVFAPLTSSFVGYAPAGPSTPQPTPGLSALGLASQSYFAPSTNLTHALTRPRSALALGGNFGALGSTANAVNEDQAPRSRKEWVERWKSDNPSRPHPVSAKAIYKLADKLDVPELKQRAFEHILRSLTPGNVPYEVFSSFSAHYEEVRKVQVDYFLAHWSEIRNGEAMRNVFQQIRLGRHPGFEEIWPLIVQHLVFRPDGAGVGVRGGAAKAQGMGEGRERTVGGEV